MKSRERVLRALEHEEVDVVPYLDFFDSMEVAMRYCGERILEADSLEQTIFLARLFNTDIAWIPTAGFPGGPGIFEEVLYQGKYHLIAKTPFDGLLYWRKKPYFALPLTAPIKSEEDLDQIEKPDIDDFKPKVEILAKKAQKLHELDYWVETEIKGPLESPWMYLRGGYVNFFTDIIRNRDFAKRTIELVFTTILELTELVLDEAPINSVWMTEDMGETRGPFISPKIYRDIIMPWHKEAAKRIHKKGAKFCLHSHGNIMLLLDDITKTGADSIDPLDIADGIDLSEVKEKYGDRVCLRGGLTKDIGRMSRKELKEHVQEVFRCAGPTGHLAMSAGGVPPEMPLESFNYYRTVVEKARKFKL